MKEIVIRIPGQKRDLVLTDLPEDLTISGLKKLIFERHEDQPTEESQRLIHSGKLLENTQHISDMNLNADSNGSSIIHLVISRSAPPPEVRPVPEPEVQPEPDVQPEPEVIPEPTAPPAEPEVNQPTQTAPPSTATADNDDAWLTPELKLYFEHWDLSIRCHELNQKFKHLVPQMKLYRACIYDNQKKLISGVSSTNTANANNELPRQNVDRDNAVLGAQGAMEDDGPADWLDRFYTLFRVALLLMLAYNYASTERFFAAVVAVITIALYQGGYFQLQRRRRPNNDPNENGNRENPDRPGVFRMLFIFITRFITSLVPAQNPPVNIN